MRLSVLQIIPFFLSFYSHSNWSLFSRIGRGAKCISIISFSVPTPPHPNRMLLRISSGSSSKRGKEIRFQYPTRKYSTQQWHKLSSSTSTQISINSYSSFLHHSLICSNSSKNSKNPTSKHAKRTILIPYVILRSFSSSLLRFCTKHDVHHSHTGHHHHPGAETSLHKEVLELNTKLRQLLT